jgi:hypothetical protein
MTKQDGRFSTVIRKSVRRLFFKEPNKGRLINDLLEAHYELERAEGLATPPVPKSPNP